MAFSQKLHSNLSRLAIPPKQQSTTNDWSPYQSEPVPPGVGRAPRAVGVPHRPPVAAYAVPTSLAAMSLSPGDVFNLPPPPPRSPGSAGSGSFPQQRLVVQPPSIQTTLGGVHQQGLSGGSSPYPYSPSITLNTPLSPYDPGSLPFSHLSRSQNNSATNSPMASRPSTGNTMVTEYNPQQWGRTGASSGSAGAQYRPFNTRVQNVLAPRALDDSGDSPPPPYSPPPNQSISQTLRPAQHRSPLSQPNPRSPPNLHTSFPSPQATLAAEYASPLSAVTVISAMTGHNHLDLRDVHGSPFLH
ncbi:hypothetical protein EJ08DRAFT_469384 [Tothia fuscella]|uniref:Uncharacterized protein n=1 Tax=Tothia fuscella TaxID=1048955 RepID=A0A9P4P0M6_9PEZI|nr:hypothetical protein EJ08DRAFT_469384 [Tothia fuscella]